MGQQLLENDAALRLFFTDPIFIAVDKTSAGAKMADNTPQEQAVESPVAKPSKGGHQPDQPMPSIQPNFTFIGGNEQHILVLVNDSSHSVSNPEGAELLRNILKFMQLKTADFALVNYANNTTATFTELREFFKPKLMLGFGIDAESLGLADAQPNTPTKMDECMILLAKDLPAMSADNNEKRTFLTALKAL